MPATPGAERVGRVTAVGAGVTHVKPGDLVINLQRENWTQRRRVKADDVIALPPSIDLRQAAMLRINPATALLLLTSLRWDVRAATTRRRRTSSSSSTSSSSG